MDEYLIFCINCDLLLTISQIPDHSQNCCKPNTEDQTSLPRINTNLKSYRKSVTQFLKSSTTLSHSQRHKLKSCISKCKECEKSDAELTSLYQAVHKLNNYLEVEQDIQCTIIIQRLKVLIEEKALKMIEKIKSTVFNVEPEDNLTCCQDLKVITSEFLKSRKVEMGPDENEISFTINTKDIEKSFNIGNSEDLVMGFPDSDDLPNDRLFKHFKNLCDLCRLDFEINHPAQRFSSLALYRKSKSFGVSADNWEDFIFNEFKNAVETIF